MNYRNETPTTPEPIEPTDPEPSNPTDPDPGPMKPLVDLKPGDAVLAPHEKDAVSGCSHKVRLVRFWTQGQHEMAEVKDDTGSWSVLASSLQPLRSDG
jgi:hypothetical protein